MNNRNLLLATTVFVAASAIASAVPPDNRNLRQLNTRVANHDNALIGAEEITCSVSGSNTCYGLANLSGTVIGVKAIVQQMPAGQAGGTSSTASISVSGSVIASGTISASAVAGTPVNVTIGASSTSVNKGDVIGISTGAGLTSSDTKPNALNTRFELTISPTWN